MTMPDAKVFATQSQWRMGTGPGSFEVPVTANEKQLALQVLAARAECERLRKELAAMQEAAKTLWDTFHVDDEGGSFVYWTTKPHHVQAFMEAMGLSDYGN